MARGTPQQVQATRQSILEAAVQVFLERGYHRSAMQHVADRAGVTRGAVYWHFRDRLDLLDALLRMTPLPWQVLISPPEPVAAHAPAAQQWLALTRMAVAPLVRLEGSVPAQQLLCILGQMNAPDGCTVLRSRLDAGRDAGLQCLQTALRHAVASGAMRQRPKREGAQAHGACVRGAPLRSAKADPEAAALGLFALVDGLMQQWLRQPAAFGLTAVGTQAVQALLAGLPQY